MIYRLGLTQTLIQGGIAYLEEARDTDGKLEDLSIRVRSYVAASTRRSL